MSHGANNWQPGDPDLARLLDRVRGIEARIDGLVLQAEARWQQYQAGHEKRRARWWQIVTLVIGGLVLPLAVIGVVALLH